MEERLIAAICALRQDMEYRFRELDRKLDTGLDDAAKERKSMMEQNNKQDEMLQAHEQRLDNVEGTVSRWQWVLAGIGTLLLPVIIWGLIEIVKYLIG